MNRALVNRNEETGNENSYAMELSAYN